MKILWQFFYDKRHIFSGLDRIMSHNHDKSDCPQYKDKISTRSNMTDLTNKHVFHRKLPVSLSFIEILRFNVLKLWQFLPYLYYLVVLPYLVYYLCRAFWSKWTNRIQFTKVCLNFFFFFKNLQNFLNLFGKHRLWFC